MFIYTLNPLIQAEGCSRLTFIQTVQSLRLRTFSQHFALQNWFSVFTFNLQKGWFQLHWTIFHTFSEKVQNTHTDSLLLEADMLSLFSVEISFKAFLALQYFPLHTSELNFHCHQELCSQKPPKPVQHLHIWVIWYRTDSSPYKQPPLVQNHTALPRLTFLQLHSLEFWKCSVNFVLQFVCVSLVEVKKKSNIHIGLFLLSASLKGAVYQS